MLFRVLPELGRVREPPPVSRFGKDTRSRTRKAFFSASEVEIRKAAVTVKARCPADGAYGILGRCGIGWSLRRAGASRSSYRPFLP